MSELSAGLMTGLNEAPAHACGEHVPGLRVHVIAVSVADDAETPSGGLK